MAASRNKLRLTKAWRRGYRSKGQARRKTGGEVVLKAEAEKLLQDAADKIAAALNAVRSGTPEGHCRACHSAAGKQHEQYCAVWPLILWRQRYNDLRTQEVIDDEKGAT